MTCSFPAHSTFVRLTCSIASSRTNSPSGYRAGTRFSCRCSKRFVVPAETRVTPKSRRPNTRESPSHHPSGHVRFDSPTIEDVVVLNLETHRGAGSASLSAAVYRPSGVSGNARTATIAGGTWRAMSPIASLVLTLSAVSASPTSGTNESTNTTAATRTNVRPGVAERCVNAPYTAVAPTVPSRVQTTIAGYRKNSVDATRPCRSVIQPSARLTVSAIANIPAPRVARARAVAGLRWLAHIRCQAPLELREHESTPNIE